MTEPPQSPPRILLFPDLEELVFAAGADPDTLIAFEKSKAAVQLQQWADEQGFGRELAEARANLQALPVNPSAGVDQAAELAEIERINQAMEALAAELGLPLSDPKVLEAAHDREIVGSAQVFQGAYLQGTSRTLDSNCPDLTALGPGWQNGALSARTRGVRPVQFFEQRNYGPPPERSAPLLTTQPISDTKLSLRPILSVFFQ